MKTKTLLCLWLPLVLVCACAKFQDSLFLSDADADETKVGILVRFSEPGSPDGLSGDVPTRSSWTGDPDRVDSFVLMAYREGCLESCVRAREGASVSIKLFKGRRYQLYALANVPDFVPPRREAEMETLSLPVGDFQQRSFLPMACRVDAFLPQHDGQALVLSFERLFAQLQVHLDKGALGLLRVGSLRLRQVASSVHPFTAADAELSYLDGDVASDADLQRLNAGDNLILYVPQNRQGTLLPGNDDPFLRVPDSLGEKAGRCTYLELSASQDGETLLSGDALCRVYLGLNAADNFDVPGNASLNLTLFLTDRLLGGDWGWRIDSRLSWQPDAVTGWLDAGMHALDDLYVGEVFRYAVRPSDAFLEAIGGDFSRCSLRFDGSSDLSAPSREEPDTSLLFSSWTASGEGVWMADAHCRKPVDAGRIRLCLDGRELFDLTTGLAVQVPDIALQEPSAVYINADTPAACPLDVKDRQGRSLSAAYGFDPDVFALEYALTVNPEWETPDISEFSCLTAGLPSASAPFGSCQVDIRHTGSNQPLSRFLTESLRREAVFNLRVRDNRYGMEASCPLRTDIPPIQVHLTDGGAWDADWTLCVSNPSALPMEWGLVVSPEKNYDLVVSPPAPVRSYNIIDITDEQLSIVERESVRFVGSRDTLVLKMSASTVSNHCQSCGCVYKNARVGLEPSLCYGERRDARLDGKIEWTCSLVGDNPPLMCLFSSDSEWWNGTTDHPLPVLLRYSAYDDIGQLHVVAGFSQTGMRPTVTLFADTDDQLFNVAYYGYINGYVYYQSSNYSHINVPMPYSVRRNFFSSRYSVPPDGQTRFFEDDNFSARCREILQIDNDGYNKPYVAYPSLELVEYGVSVFYEPCDRIYSLDVSGSLRFSYYSSRYQTDLYVGSSLTSIVQEQLYIFEH